MSPTKAPTPGESPQPEVGGSGAALPLKTAPHRERVLEAAREILARVHALHLQTMHKMGSVRELDQTLALTLLAESARAQLIIGEDFTKSLITLHTDLEASCEVLLSDIARTLNLHPDDPASHQGLGAGSGSRTWQARGVPASHSRTSDGSTSRG